MGLARGGEEAAKEREKAMIIITIKTDNEAFGDGNREAEIARILRTMADAVQFGGGLNYPRDINGNRVGNVVATGKDRDLA